MHQVPIPRENLHIKSKPSTKLYLLGKKIMLRLHVCLHEPFEAYTDDLIQHLRVLIPLSELFAMWMPTLRRK